MNKMQEYIDGLMHADESDAFLVISVSGADDDFLQLTGDARGVQIDFPLITARQRSLEPKIRLAAERLGLSVVETRGSDGSRFLDINMNGTPAEVARVCWELMRDVFEVNESAELEFNPGGLG